METQKTNLRDWGFHGYFEAMTGEYPGLTPARVTEQHRNLYRVVSAKGMLQAQVSGKFAYETEDAAAFPAVGDWVMAEHDGTAATIHAVLPRRSAFERKAAGAAHATQVVAANIDTAFLCMSLNEDYNLRRLERYLSIAWDSRAVPVVVLTKSDLCGDLAGCLAEVSGIAFGADVLVCSGRLENGYAEILPYLKERETVAFIGSSGVGKSTMINALAGKELLATKDIREDGKGRHTTTHRQLIRLPGRGLLIDTPGMREIGVESADLRSAFREIEELAAGCRFSDCTHGGEPGCAVLAAVERGSLAPERLESYRKLKNEAGYDGLSAKQIEEAKIKRMFGGKGEMKRTMRDIKRKNNGR